jgi:hypothetical protein
MLLRIPHVLTVEMPLTLHGLGNIQIRSICEIEILDTRH